MKNTFGFVEFQTEHYFKVVVDRVVTFHECYIQHNFIEDTEELIEEEKAVLTIKQWELIKPVVQYIFNSQLKEEGKRTSRFVKGDNYLSKLYGKQLLVLVWAIELTDKQLDIKNAVLNWKGFSREEQWWLFTMINAASGKSKDRFGWRAGIKEVLLYNPTNKGGANNGKLKK